ncbi:Fn3-like domain-containing protein [Brachybacterium sp. GPGPB12]|uniref:Fn3-like domain-containing protein n=1 Tax=Brachybacterium sp. GPGPB12 TaxID=3023517 RepID=UPI0031345891
MLNMVAAVRATSSVTTPTISLGEGEAGPKDVTLTVTNDSDAEKVYDVGFESGVATAIPTSNPEFYTAEATTGTSAEQVTVPAHGSAEVTVTLGEDFGTDGLIYGGWITLTGADDDLVVPFAGLSGDYQALTVLDDQGMGLPGLGVSDGAGSARWIPRAATPTRWPTATCPTSPTLSRSRPSGSRSRPTRCGPTGSSRSSTPPWARSTRPITWAVPPSPSCSPGTAPSR